MSFVLCSLKGYHQRLYSLCKQVDHESAPYKSFLSLRVAREQLSQYCS